jgi:hypothetical protein
VPLRGTPTPRAAYRLEGRIRKGRVPTGLVDAQDADSARRRIRERDKEIRSNGIK